MFLSLNPTFFKEKEILYKMEIKISHAPLFISLSANTLWYFNVFLYSAQWGTVQRTSGCHVSVAILFLFLMCDVGLCSFISEVWWVVDVVRNANLKMKILGL